MSLPPAAPVTYNYTVIAPGPNTIRIDSVATGTPTGNLTLNTYTDGVTYTIIEIGSAAFQNRNTFYAVTSSTVKVVGTGAFQGCTGIVSVNLSALTTLGNYAFNGCSSLSTITSLGSISSIAEYTFQNCIALTNGNVSTYSSSPITSIQNSSFDGCRGLISFSAPSLTAGNLGTAVLSNCTNLQGNQINLGSITIIPQATFSNCRFTSMIIQNISSAQITLIDDYAFANNSSLTNVTIPVQAGVAAQIQDFAFENCSALQSVYIASNDPPTLGTTPFNGTTARIYYPTAATGTDAAWTAAFPIPLTAVRLGLPTNSSAPVIFANEAVGVTAINEQSGAVLNGVPIVSYQWYRDSSLVSGAINRQYSYPEFSVPTSFSVTAFDPLGQGTTSPSVTINGLDSTIGTSRVSFILTP